MVGDSKRRDFLKLVGLGAVFEEALSAGSGLRLKVDGGETRPGESTRIRFELSNDGTATMRRPGIRFCPPVPEWRPEAFHDDGGRRVRDTAATDPAGWDADTVGPAADVVGWDWPSLAPGETVRPSYSLRPPRNAEPGTYVVSARPVGPEERVQTTTATPATTMAQPLSEGLTALETTVAQAVESPNATVTVQSDDEGFVDILSIDPSNYPEVLVNVGVATEAGRDGELTADDFRVIENGVRQTIESFRFRNVAVDLAFVFDDTGSMSEEIATMKREVKDLTDKVEAAGIDARYALVSFKDDVDVDRRFTDDATELKRAVDRLEAEGGDDDPEDNFDAIERTLGFDFRPDAQKVVVDITDAVSHYRGDGSNVSNYTLSEVATDISERGVTYVAVAPSTRDPRASKRALAEETDGLWMNVTEADFDEILERITELVITAYVLRYRTDAPRGESRNVGVEVRDPERGVGRDAGEVTIPEEDGVGESFERERTNKLVLAGRIDDATAADLEERSQAEAACDELASAVDAGVVSSADAAEAVRRMRFGEQVTERLTAVIGPASLETGAEDRYNVARRMGSLTLDATVDFVLGQLAIGEKIKEKVGDAFGGSLGTLEVGLRIEWLNYDLEFSKSVDVLDYLLEEAAAKLQDGLETFLQLVLGDSSRAVEAAESGSRKVADDVYSRIASGAITTASEARRIVDELTESIVDGLADAIRGFVEQFLVVDVGDPASFGDEVWGIDGSLAHFHETLDPESVASGLDGSTAGAKRVRDDATTLVRDTADGVTSTFDTIDAASAEWNLVDAVFDVIQAGDDADWWTLVRNFVEAVLGVVSSVLDLVKAGVGIGTLVGLALGHHETLKSIARGGRSG